MSRLDPYNRIMEAAKKGCGVHLSADEVWYLHLDDAIQTHAMLLEERGEHTTWHVKKGIQESK